MGVLMSTIPFRTRAPAAPARMHVMKPDKQSLHFAGRVVRVTTDEVVLPNGHRTVLEVVHHPGGAAAVASARRVRRRSMQKSSRSTGCRSIRPATGRSTAPSATARPPSACCAHAPSSGRTAHRRQPFRDLSRGIATAPTGTLRRGEAGPVIGSDIICERESKKIPISAGTAAGRAAPRRCGGPRRARQRLGRVA